MKIIENNNLLIKAGYISHFITDFYASFLIPMLPVILKNFNLSLLNLSIVISCSYFLSSILQPFWGYLADRQKKYYFLIFGSLITSICITALFFTKNVYFTIFFILLANLGEGIYHPQATSFMTEVSKHLANKNLGIFLSLGSLGFAIGPLLAGFLNDSMQFQYLLLLILLAIFANVFIFFIIFPLGKTKNLKLEFMFFEELKQIFVNEQLRKLVNIGFVRPLVLVSLCIFMPFKWSSMGYSNFKIGLFLGLFSLIGAFGVYSGGIVFSKYNKFFCFKLSIILTTICGFLYLCFIEHRFAIIFFLLTSFCVNQISSVNLSLAHKLLPQNKSSISGLINGYNWGVVGITLWVTGFFITKFDYNIAIGFVLLIPLFFIFRIKTLFNEKI